MKGRVNLKYVMGIDYGTNGVRVGIFDLQGKEIVFSDEDVETIIPKNGWAEQSTFQWWNALGRASKQALKVSGISPDDIIGISYDQTSCTVIACDRKGRQLRNAILWMDVRAVKEAQEVTNSKDESLRINGFGNVSPEWMLPKVMWLKRHEPEIYKKADIICEAADWLGYKLTNKWTCNINNVTLRWYYDRANGGWPVKFYQKMGVGDVFKKFPETINDLGVVLGPLSQVAADNMGLNAGTTVGQGGVDATVGMIGMGAIRDGQTALITGTSHLLFAVTKKSMHKSGMWGTYTDCILPHLNLVEGGQISTGSIMKWFVTNMCQDLIEKGESSGESVYDLLNKPAIALLPGSDGLIMTDFWQGNRSPYTDGGIRGMIYGLSLENNRAHIYRAIMESIAYGTNNIIQEFKDNGFSPKDIVICGGAAYNDLFLQIHADVANIPLKVPNQLQAPCLGSAILAAVAAGEYADIPEAVTSMVSYNRVIKPIPENHRLYQKFFNQYKKIYPLFSGWMHQATALNEEVSNC